MKHFIAGPWFIFLMAALLGGIFFISFYGVYVLNPLHIDWLMSGDSKIHYLGWDFFRRCQWTFPIGTISQLAYPFGIPLTYTDSIPLIAIPLKLVSGILPNNFQYFGLWGLFCYMLQGGFSALIMRRWTKNMMIILICSAIFIVSPVLMFRMFYHTALASQWIILASIWLTFEWRKIRSVNYQVLVWSTLLVLAVLIHPYFIPMVGLFFLMSIILTHHNWAGTVIKILTPVCLMLFVFWVIGGFSISEVAGSGLGAFALNLNSLVNPLGWSRFLTPMAINNNSSESINYLGLGALMLMPVSAYLAFAYIKDFGNLKRLVGKVKLKHISIAALTVGMCLVAIGPTIQLGDRIIADVTLPAMVKQILSIFRASARLFWPIYYLIIAGVLACIIKSSKNMSTALLCVFLGMIVTIQVIDIRFSSSAREKHTMFTSTRQEGYNPSIDLSGWRNYAFGRKHVVYLDSISIEDSYKLIDIARRYGLTINDGYFARVPYHRVNNFKEEHRRLLIEKHSDILNNLYITKDEGFISILKNTGSYNIDQLDGYYIISRLL